MSFILKKLTVDNVEFSWMFNDQSEFFTGYQLSGKYENYQRSKLIPEIKLEPNQQSLEFFAKELINEYNQKILNNINQLEFDTHGVSIFDSNDYWMGRRTSPELPSEGFFDKFYIIRIHAHRIIKIIIDINIFDGIINTNNKINVGKIIGKNGEIIKYHTNKLNRKLIKII